MINPTARVALFLGFIRGNKVNGWAQQQAELISTCVFGAVDNQGNQIAPATHFNDDEFPWNDMYHNFLRAFHYGTKEEDTFIKLQKCKMGERSPDEYIAEFNELIQRANWEPTAKGTIEMFKMGLPMREQTPDTLGEWQEGLRREVERNRLIQASIGNWQQRGGNISTPREPLQRNP